MGNSSFKEIGGILPIEKILQSLRDALVSEQLDGWLVPMADPFQNEYVEDHFNRVQYVSGFTGSAGMVLIMQDQAALFTDGRYTEQAYQELDSRLFEVHGHGFQAMGDFLKSKGKLRIGFDPLTITVSQKKQLRAVPMDWVAVDSNPVDALWENRPNQPWASLKIHDEKFSGVSSKDKRSNLSQELKRKNLDAALFTLGDSIAWLLNLRGGDLASTPIFYSYAVLHANGKVDLFVDTKKIGLEVTEFLGKDVTIHPLETVSSFLEKLEVVGFDPACTPVSLASKLNQGKEIKDPTLLPKACKNPVEQEGARQCHIVDGIALTKFLYFLHNRSLGDGLDEQGSALKLRSLRDGGEHYQGDSFETISAAGPNGALCHYCVNDKTNRPLKSGELYLVDSGGQYLTGTTDVTRTVLVGGSATEKMKEHYTRVLKGHIAIACAVFPKGTTGTQLDMLARQALWEVGLDFPHSTGHGVGSYLSVHEGPQGITPRNSTTPLMLGMILSNEPGYYLAGHYGIRLENLILVQECEDRSGFLKFENLTWAPFDGRLIDPALLSDQEREWLRWYHAKLIEKLSHGLSEEEKVFCRNSWGNF